MEKAENIREFSFCKLPETTECVDFLFPNSFYAIIHAGYDFGSDLYWKTSPALDNI